MRFIFSLIIACILHSCVDVIDLQIPRDIDQSIVINAKLAKADITSVHVNIQQIRQNGEGVSKPLSIKSILLQDRQGNQINIPQRDLGNYSTMIDEEFVNYNNDYKLVITLFNGRIIESTYQTLRRLPRNNTLTFDKEIRPFVNELNFSEQKEYLSFNLRTELPVEEGTKVRHDVIHTYRFTDYFRGTRTGLPKANKTCYVTEYKDIQETKFLDPSKLVSLIDQEGKYNTVLFDEVLSFTYYEGSYITLIQESISQEVVDYFEKIYTITHLDGNMFEAQPARIESNFTFQDNEDGNVYGYFYAAEQDTTRVFLSPEIAESPDTICLRPPPAVSSGTVLSPESTCRWFLPVCCECLDINGSSLEKPSFWVD